MGQHEVNVSGIHRAFSFGMDDMTLHILANTNRNLYGVFGCTISDLTSKVSHDHSRRDPCATAYHVVYPKHDSTRRDGCGRGSGALFGSAFIVGAATMLRLHLRQPVAPYVRASSAHAIPSIAALFLSEMIPTHSRRRSSVARRAQSATRYTHRAYAPSPELSPFP